MSKLTGSIACAARGIRWVVSSQRNMRIHLLIAAAVLMAAVWLRLGGTELALIVFAVCMVLVAETINSAIEKTVDLVTLERHPLAGLAKDAAAGAVLIAGFFSVVIGFIVFFPYIKGLKKFLF